MSDMHLSGLALGPSLCCIKAMVVDMLLQSSHFSFRTKKICHKQGTAVHIFSGSFSCKIHKSPPKSCAQAATSENFSQNTVVRLYLISHHRYQNKKRCFIDDVRGTKHYKVNQKTIKTAVFLNKLLLLFWIRLGPRDVIHDTYRLVLISIRVLQH